MKEEMTEATSSKVEDCLILRMGRGRWERGEVRKRGGEETGYYVK